METTKEKLSANFQEPPEAHSYSSPLDGRGDLSSPYGYGDLRDAPDQGRGGEANADVENAGSGSLFDDLHDLPDIPEPKEDEGTAGEVGGEGEEDEEAAAVRQAMDDLGLDRNAVPDAFQLMRMMPPVEEADVSEASGKPFDSMAAARWELEGASDQDLSSDGRWKKALLENGKDRALVREIFDAHEKDMDFAHSGLTLDERMDLVERRREVDAALKERDEDLRILDDFSREHPFLGDILKGSDGHGLAGLLWTLVGLGVLGGVVFANGGFQMSGRQADGVIFIGVIAMALTISLLEGIRVACRKRLIANVRKAEAELMAGVNLGVNLSEYGDGNRDEGNGDGFQRLTDGMPSLEGGSESASADEAAKSPSPEGRDGEGRGQA